MGPQITFRRLSQLDVFPAPVSILKVAIRLFNFMSTDQEAFLLDSTTASGLCSREQQRLLQLFSRSIEPS